MAAEYNASTVGDMLSVGPRYRGFGNSPSVRLQISFAGGDAEEVWRGKRLGVRYPERNR